jgi:hypothetical protein
MNTLVGIALVAIGIGVTLAAQAAWRKLSDWLAQPDHDFDDEEFN